MNFKFILSIGCMSLFAVSCAHKPMDKEHTKLTQDHPISHESKPVKEVTPVVESKKGDISFNCKFGEDSRTITLQKGNNRCEVHYTKSGTLNNIAWAEKTPSLCDKVFDNVRNNIEKGGFKCADEGQKTASVGN